MRPDADRAVRRTVIVGGSVGGVRTAQALRAKGYQDEIVLIEREDEVPYDKPPLSKELLAGRSNSDDIRLLTREQAADLDVRLYLGTTVRGLLHPRKIDLEGQDPLTYDYLVVSTGSTPVASPWGARPGIRLLRTLKDARRLREDLDTGGRLAVIGAGFIGAEVAATARQQGSDVTIIDPLSTPMSRAFEPDIGHIFLDLHERHGVTCHFGSGVTAIDGHQGDFNIRIHDGRTVDAAVVVVGIGATPNTSWLHESHLTLSHGLLCDDKLRSIDDPYVYAVGDVARWHDLHTGELTCREHWTNTVDQAITAAHNITHPEDLRSYEPNDYIWTDQYDWKIQAIGHTVGAPTRTICGDPDSGRFAVAYGNDHGTFIGAVTANWPRALVTSRKALKTGETLNKVVSGLGIPIKTTVTADQPSEHLAP